MRFIIILLGFFSLTASPAMADDVFSYFEKGQWGIPSFPELSCESNPVEICFNPDKTRMTLHYQHLFYDYAGDRLRQYGYDIISYDQDGIVMAMDDEQRLTPDGATVVWVLKPLPKDMFCWGRTDWPATGCINIHVRCPELPASS